MKNQFISLLLLLSVLSVAPLLAQPVTRYQTSGGTQTPTYTEVIQWWQALAQKSEYVSIKEAGLTDSGEPLHLVLYSASTNFNLEELRKQNKTILFINNGIHPGEPDGIDASMQLIKELVENKKLRKATENVVIGLIPVYNIGGALNRNAHTRANQAGPEEYGFRGNARNYDLNRDFIKMDSRNAFAWVEIFQKLKPQLYIETHVSNGADYQYTMTLLSTQHSKLGGPLGQYLKEELEPKLYLAMEQKDQLMTPYVNVWGGVPDSGWVAFLDGPRYSSGYTALHNTIGLVTETHMLKPYPQRVKATYHFLQSAVEVLAGQVGNTIKSTQERQLSGLQAASQLPISWQADTTTYTPFMFRGYTGTYETSSVSGLKRLQYHRGQPYQKQIKFYDTFTPTSEKKVPAFYVVPQGWWPIIERLKANGVQMNPLTKDTLMTAERYRVVDYKTATRPYEGHYVHSNVQVEAQAGIYQLKAGDMLISTQQPARRFLVEVLEPEAPDSYFAWNFFDTILQQKEGFSDYVFEDEAAAMLRDKPALRAELEKAKLEDENLAKSAYLQLYWVYKHSPNYEDAYLNYPILKVY